MSSLGFCKFSQFYCHEHLWHSAPTSTQLVQLRIVLPSLAKFFFILHQPRHRSRSLSIICTHTYTHKHTQQNTHGSIAPVPECLRILKKNTSHKNSYLIIEITVITVFSYSLCLLYPSHIFPPTPAQSRAQSSAHTHIPPTFLCRIIYFPPFLNT